MTRPRCQRGAPHRTNDVDTDKRRRTLEGVPAPYPLTFGVIEGSHERTSISLTVRYLSEGGRSRTPQ
jgi:hypothetical protein